MVPSRNSVFDRLSCPERFSSAVVRDLEAALLASPARVSPCFEAKPFVIAESVFLLQIEADRNFESTPVTPLERVLVVSDERP